MASSTEPSELREKFVAKLGDAAWDESWESVAKLSPELYEACTELIAVPRRKKHLSPKVQEFIALTVDSAATHLYVPGIKRHIDAALHEGATPAELIEVMELTATLGIHACSIGVPALWEVMDEMGIEKRKAGNVSDEERESLRASFIKNRGYINPNWEKLLSLSPEFFAAYLHLSSVPWMKDVDGKGKVDGVLEPKVCMCWRSRSSKLSDQTG